MGQIVTGLMLGRKQRYSETVEEILDEADILYSERPGVDESGTYFGFLYAISRGSEDGCADLDKPLTLAEIPNAFPKAKAKARKNWDKFTALVKAKCTNKTLLAFVTGEPEIILVQTEVA